MLHVAIIGASGYTGGELVRLLSCHPEVEIVVATSRQYEGTALAEVFPHLRSRTNVICSSPAAEELTDQADFIFCAVPHQTAMSVVPGLLEAGKRVVDLSADFRFRDVGIYEQWYQPHSAPQLSAAAIYGLPELHREQIRNARLVANPGCYPTSVTLALAPFLKAGVIDPATIIIDSKSGTSGAGRGANLGTSFCEVTDGFRAYKVGGTHRHTPEIEQNLSEIAGKPLTVSFTPHLLPISRGILSTIYCSLLIPTDERALHQLLADRYRSEPFVRVLEIGQQPATQYVRGSNYCDIGMVVDHRTNRLILTSAIDNIVKGASGQAIQNMNLMCGFAEETGLLQIPIFP